MFILFRVKPLFINRLMGTFLSRMACPNARTESIDDMSRLNHSTDPAGNPAFSTDLYSRSLLGPSLQPINRHLYSN